MEDKDNMLDAFYKKSLGNLKIEEDGSEWYELELRMEKAKFFTFGWHYFNIFYALLIGIVFIATSSIFIDYFFLGRNQTATRQITKRNSVKSAEAVGSAEKTRKSDLAKDDHSFQRESSKKASGKKQERPKDTTDAVKSSSTQDIKILENVPRFAEEGKMPDSEVVYIRKRDTILVVDSVRITRKIKKRNR